MKKVKKVLSIFLVMALAFGIFSVSGSAEPAPADYSAVDAAIAAMLPNETNLFFYTDEAIDLVNDVLENVIDRGLYAPDQGIVDSYVDLVEGLAS